MAGTTYSIADIVGFNMFAGLPMMSADVANDEKTPHLMRWLREMYQRPAARKSLELGRTEMMRRYAHLERPGNPGKESSHA